METKELVPLVISFISLLITIIVQWEKIVNANWGSLIKLFAGFALIGIGLYFGYQALNIPSYQLSQFFVGANGVIQVAGESQPPSGISGANMFFSFGAALVCIPGGIWVIVQAIKEGRK